MYAQSAIQQQLANTVTFFTEKKATSESSSIAMTPLDWAKLGHSADPTKLGFLNPYAKLIKKTTDDRYYLDENTLNKVFAEQSDAGKAFLLLFSIAIITLICIGIVGVVTGEL